MLSKDAPFKPRKLPRAVPPEAFQQSPYFESARAVAALLAGRASDPLAAQVLANHEGTRIARTVAARRRPASSSSRTADPAA